MLLWLHRLLGNAPRKDPLYDWAISNGKRIEFDEPLTTWQALAEISRREREEREKQ